MVFVAVRVYCWLTFGLATGFEMALFDKPVEGDH